MRKTGIFCIILFLLIIPSLSLAHPGNTASDGCHYCRTNCSSWGEVYGARHCHNSGSSYDSYDYNYDSYNYNTYTTPDCSEYGVFAYYNAGYCTCMSGYVMGKGILGDTQCISRDSDCKDKYGYNAKYNSLASSCECKYGYVVDTNYLGNETCVDGDSYCRDEYGYHSDYNATSNACECDYGYYMTSSGCEEEEDDDYVSDIDWNAFIDSLCYDDAIYSDGNCICGEGYVYRNDKCITYTENCINSFGQNVFGIKGETNNSSCYCNSGYEWNSDKTSCIKKVDPVVYENMKTMKDSVQKNIDIPATNLIVEIEKKDCDNGYVLFSDQCIRIPKHAHAVDSSVDAWLCDEKYKELEGECFFIEEGEDIIDIVEDTLGEKAENSKEEIVSVSGDEQKIEERPKENKVKSFFKNLFGKIKSWF